MSQSQRSSDVIEIFAARLFSCGIGAVVAYIIAGLIYAYRGSSEMFVPLAIVITVIGTVLLAVALYNLVETRKVTRIPVECPYCHAKTNLTAHPTIDFRCESCQRLVPVKDGRILPIMTVNCGHCQERNFYSERTDTLLCESCNHQISIAHQEGFYSSPTAASYAVQEDTRPYELILKDAGYEIEEVSRTLQQMLALNHPQVRQLLNELPTTLLTGIPKQKAEMLCSQLVMHHATAFIRAID